MHDQVAAAAAFLDWLTARGLTLAACTQAELDQWLAGTSSHLARSANFVRWAVSPPARLRPHRPGHALDRPVRAARPGPPLGRRTAAPPRRHLPGRRPRRRAARPALRPEAHRHHRPDNPARPARGRPHPPPPGQPPGRPARPAGRPRPGLRPAARPAGSSLLGVPSPWLFPGRRPGSALTPDALGQRLHALGISPRQGRSTALFTLAAEIPAAILAKTLGIHIQVADPLAEDLRRRLDRLRRRRQPQDQAAARSVTSRNAGPDVTPGTRCPVCGRQLPGRDRPRGGRKPRYCSGACKAKAYRARQHAGTPRARKPPLPAAARHARAIEIRQQISELTGAMADTASGQQALFASPGTTPPRPARRHRPDPAPADHRARRRSPRPRPSRNASRFAARQTERRRRRHCSTSRNCGKMTRPDRSDLASGPGIQTVLITDCAVRRRCRRAPRSRSRSPTAGNAP